MDFINHREGGMVFYQVYYQVFLLSPLQCTVSELYSRNCKRLREFEDKELQGKAVEVTVNSKEENS